MDLFCPVDNLLVKIDKKFQDEIEFDGGLKMSIYTHVNQSEHTTLKGTVVSLPKRLKGIPDTQRILPELQVGDEIYFSYHVVFDQHNTESATWFLNEIKEKGESYWMVDYQHVFFAKRGEEILMVGGYVLVEPMYQQLPKTILVLPEAVEKKEYKDRGKVIAIGVPLKGEINSGVEIGDVVRFEGCYTQSYNFNGLLKEKHYIVKQSRLLAKE